MMIHQKKVILWYVAKNLRNFKGKRKISSAIVSSGRVNILG